MNQSITITIDRLRCYAFHGVMEQERSVGAEYEVTLSIRYPAMRAVTADSLADTVDYVQLCDIVKGAMSHPAALLERVCGVIIEDVMRAFPLTEGGTVTVSKLNPPISNSSMASASVTVSW